MASVRTPIRTLVWILIWILILVQAICSAVYAKDAPKDTSVNLSQVQTTTFTYNDIDGNEVRLSISDRLQMPSHKALQLIHEINRYTTDDLMISYPESIRLNPAELEQAITDQDRLTFLLPIASTAFLQKSAKIVSNTLYEDPVGIVIVTVATAYDNFLWFHADSLESDQKVFMATFNTIIAASFGFHKELWTKTTKPIQSRVTSLFSYANWFRSQPKKKDLLTSFTASFILGLPIQFTRFAILDLHDLVNAMQTVYFWGSTLSVSLLFTFTSFSWSEQIYNVDKIKNPLAKAFLRRFMEVRQSIMGYLAPTGKVMQPDAYGFLPIAVSALHGVAGLVFLLRSEHIVSWLERNNTIQNLYKWHQKAEHKIFELTVGAKMYWSDCMTLLRGRDQLSSE